MTYIPKRLHKWTLPECYIGEHWEGFYSAGFGQTRDSDALERSNFAEILIALKSFMGQEIPDGYGADSGGPAVRVVTEGHWAVGWVEWIAIHESCDGALKIADELRSQADDYPVLNEDAFSELEYSEACDLWERLSVRERAEMIAESRCGASIFAARRAELPQDDNGALLERLR